MYNLEIRDALKKNRVFNYELAAALGIPETSLSRKMARAELTEDEKQLYISKIKEIKNGDESR